MDDIGANVEGLDTIDRGMMMYPVSIHYLLQLEASEITSQPVLLGVRGHVEPCPIPPVPYRTQKSPFDYLIQMHKIPRSRDHNSMGLTEQSPSKAPKLRQHDIPRAAAPAKPCLASAPSIPCDHDRQ